MSDTNPAKPDDADKTPARQTGEDNGKIRRPQQTDGTMADVDLARGSEPATHARR